MVRRFAAALAGVVFFAGFAFAMNRLALAVWPAYADVFQSHGFTTDMLFARLAAAVVALLGSGYLAARIARGERMAAVIAAGLLLLLGGANHLTEPTWSHFPIWYHLAFIGLIAPCVLIGGHFQRPTAI
ncbi:MAG: hypothetical protein H2049_03735 [Porphyrobacter sp.]|nr:hypothetical protein [Porphyrobacter sp.]